MSQNKELLTIGQLAKMTDSNVYSIRYYERIGILSPEFIDPNTQYRYYTFNQTYLIELFKICVELDIPLKNLTDFIHQETVHYDDILAYGKTIVAEKLQTLSRHLKFIEQVQENLVEETDAPYEKHFEALPVYMSENYAKLKFPDTDNLDSEFLAFGKLSLEGNIFYFTETTAKEANYVLPKGNYLCTQSYESKLTSRQNAIEVDILMGKHQVNRVRKELRIWKGECP